MVIAGRAARRRSRRRSLGASGPWGQQEHLRLLALACVVFGLALRVVVYRSHLGQLEGDEATWSLMVRNAFDGQVGAFFWGQAYGGTQEVFLAAPLFALFGTHLFLVRLVSTALGAVAALLVWRLARRLWGEPAGATAGLLLWIWPPYLVWKLEVWGGFYGSGLVYTALILLLALQLDEAPSRGRVAVFGLVLGLAFWQSLQTVVVIVPALLWLTVRRPRIWKDAWLAVPGVVVGGLPWLLSNLRHGWWSFHLADAGVTYQSKFDGYLKDTFPMALGLRVPLEISWLPPAVLGWLAYGLLLGVLAWCAWRFRGTGATLFTLLLVLYPFLYSASGLTWRSDEPRYVVLALPAVVVLLTGAVTTTRRAAVVLALAAVLSAAGLNRWIHWSHEPPKNPLAEAGVVDLGPTIAVLARDGVDRAFSNYWLAYRLMFDTRERVIVSESDMTSLHPVGPRRVLPSPPGSYVTHHHRAYYPPVRDAPRHAYLLVPGELGEARDARILLAHGYREQRAGGVLVFVSPAQAPH